LIEAPSSRSRRCRIARRVGSANAAKVWPSCRSYFSMWRSIRPAAASCQLGRRECRHNPRMKSILNIAAYKFLPLADLRALRGRLQLLCASASLKGTILLSPEGLNLFVAGAPPSVELLLEELRSWPGLGDLQPKR